MEEVIRIFEVEVSSNWSLDRINAELVKNRVFVRADNLKKIVCEAINNQYDAQQLIESCQ